MGGLDTRRERQCHKVAVKIGRECPTGVIIVIKGLLIFIAVSQVEYHLGTFSKKACDTGGDELTVLFGIIIRIIGAAAVIAQFIKTDRWVDGALARQSQFLIIGAEPDKKLAIILCQGSTQLEIFLIEFIIIPVSVRMDSIS